MGKSDQKVERVITGLDIDENIDLQIKSWEAQPVAWVLITLFIMLGALGLFGTGWLSKTVQKRGTVTLETERFFRREAPMRIVVKDEGNNGSITVGFPIEFLHAARIESVNPQPERTEYTDGLAHYIFPAHGGNREFTFQVIPETIGSVDASVKVNGQQFYQKLFIYP